MKLMLVVALVAAALAVVALLFWLQLRRLRREAFVRDYAWPPGLLDKLQGRRRFGRKESALVAEGLRSFFLAYLRSGNRYVAMPSQVADDLWHEFILYTRAYEEFCKAAFGGFLHHTPAVALNPARLKSNEGLRRVWYWCCREENINVARPTRLPLLFALDRKLRIADGYVYEPDCAALRRNGSAGTQCGGDFSSSSVDGSTSGIDGGSGSSDGSGGSDSGGGDSGGSCGGGCGGGD